MSHGYDKAFSFVGPTVSCVIIERYGATVGQLFQGISKVVYTPNFCPEERIGLRRGGNQNLCSIAPGEDRDL